MKIISLVNTMIFAAIICLQGCSQVQPQELAGVIGHVDYSMCGGCGGRFVHIDSTWYRAEVASPFNKENKSVWIRFKKDESGGVKTYGRWIIISSIRERK